MLFARHDERGVTLIECLVAIAILSIMAIGIGAATQSATTGGSAINWSERLDVQLTAFGEAIQNTKYVDCAGPGVYQFEFNNDQYALPSTQQLMASRGNRSLIFQVGSVVSACSSGQTDSGTQTINLIVCIPPPGVTDCTDPSVSKKRTAQIVKRDPDATSLQARVIISGGPGFQFPSAGYGPNEISAPVNTGTGVQSWQFSGVGSWAQAGIYAYQYTCDAQSVDPVTGVQDNPDPDNDVANPILLYRSTDVATCNYHAFPAGSHNLGYRLVTAQLTIIDMSDPPLRTTQSTLIKVYDLAPTQPALNTTISANPTTATTGVQITFHSNETGADVSEWDWNFGDASTNPNGSYVCLGSATTCGSQIHHTYLMTSASAGFPGGYPVTLTLHSASRGVATSAKLLIVITAPAQPPPVPSFTISPTSGVAPQTISLNGSASQAGMGGSLPGSAFSWQIFNGAVQVGPTLSGVQTTTKLASAATYTVQLTVRDPSTGLTASTSRTLTLTALQPPSNLSASGQIYVTIIPPSASSFVTISWTNPPRSPGDTTSLDVRLTNTNPGCGFGILDLHSSGSAISYNGQNTQTATFQVTSGFLNLIRTIALGTGLCSNSFNAQMQTYRTDSDGVTYTSGLSSSVTFSFQTHVSAF